MDTNSIVRAERTEWDKPSLSSPKKRNHPDSWQDSGRPRSRKVQESPQCTAISCFREPDSLYDVEYLPQHIFDCSGREPMSVKSICRNVKDGNQQPYSSNQQTLPLPSSCSPLISCQCPEFEEAHHRPSKPANISPMPSNLACNFCVDEASSSTACQTSDGRNCDWSSVCMDPDCSESICNECCQDCVEDCGSDCGVALGCDGVDLRSNDYYTCEGSFSELFGDQAVGLFDLDGRLPQLPIDTVPAEPIDFGLFPDDADAVTSTLTENVVPESTFNPSYQLNTSWIPTQPCSQSELPDAAKATNLDGVITLPAAPCFGYDSSPHLSFDAGVAAEGTKSTKSTPTSPSESSQDERIVAASFASTNTNTTPSTTCQWADLNGQPCGRVFPLGDDLHDHLKAVHGVKSEVMCRWIGCRVAVHGASPHQYANSVERHTWGHSGYRPYKCSTCSEGFAAAKLRDEHFTSLHLGKKTFCCDVCSHQCTSATNLKRHKDDKHRTGRFQCEFCNRRNGKRRLFPRGPNLARHFRKCKCVLAQFPEAINAATGKMDDDWLPPGYKRGHHGMDRARVVPPNFLPLPSGN